MSEFAAAKLASAKAKELELPVSAAANDAPNGGGKGRGGKARGVHAQNGQGHGQTHG